MHSNVDAMVMGDNNWREIDHSLREDSRRRAPCRVDSPRGDSRDRAPPRDDVEPECLHDRGDACRG
jgi:hypothetical protein